MAIVKKDGNSISFLNSKVKKEMAKLVGAEVQLPIGERTIFKDDSSLARLKGTPLSYPITDINHLEKFD
jgi:hypothetical protein